jgi:hypothetical protein
MLLTCNAEVIIQLPELKKMERFCTTLGELMTMASWGLEHSKANLIQYKLKEFEAKIWYRFQQEPPLLFSWMKMENCMVVEIMRIVT